LFRLLSHLQISPKVKEGRGEKRKGMEEAEEISKTSVPEISSIFKKT
jgi:hypothetical protein